MNVFVTFSDLLAIALFLVVALIYAVLYAWLKFDSWRKKRKQR